MASSIGSNRIDYLDDTLVSMTQLATEPNYLMHWDHQCDRPLLHNADSFTHRLPELPAFSDEGLAAILDCYPNSAMAVTTMGDNPAHPSELRYGTFGEHDGRQWIDMIRRGRLCICLSNVAKHDKTLGEIVGRLFSEMIECQPGLQIESLDGDLWITSPYTIHYFGIDLDPTIFWQIRGQRRVSHYPLNEPFLLDRTLEQIVSQNRRQPLYFEPAFDHHVETIEQVPGDAFGLPLHTPHRITTNGTLSLTLATTHLTRQSRHRNEVLQANHLLNRWLPNQERSVELGGAMSLAKRMMVRLGNRFSGQCQTEQPEPSFRVDPNAMNCVEMIDPGPTVADVPKNKPIFPIPPRLAIESATFAVSGTEN